MLPIAVASPGPAITRRPVQSAADLFRALFQGLGPGSPPNGGCARLSVVGKAAPFAVQLGARLRF